MTLLFKNICIAFLRVISGVFLKRNNILFFTSKSDNNLLFSLGSTTHFRVITMPLSCNMPLKRWEEGVYHFSSPRILIQTGFHNQMICLNSYEFEKTYHKDNCINCPSTLKTQMHILGHIQPLFCKVKK